MIFASTMLVRGRPSPVDVTPQVTDEEDARQTIQHGVHQTVHQPPQSTPGMHKKSHTILPCTTA